MPLFFALDSRSALVVATASGAVLPSDWRDGVAVLVADPTMPQAAPVLVDLRHADRAVAAADMGWMTVLLQRLHARFAGRVALLTAVVGHVSSANLLAGHADGVRYRVKAFTDEPSARLWLTIAN